MLCARLGGSSRCAGRGCNVVPTHDTHSLDGRPGVSCELAEGGYRQECWAVLWVIVNPPARVGQDQLCEGGQDDHQLCVTATGEGRGGGEARHGVVCHVSCAGHCNERVLRRALLTLEETQRDYTGGE